MRGERERLHRGDPLEYERSRRETFDPIVEGKRYGLEPEASAALWQHVCREGTSDDEVSNEIPARERFVRLAESIAKRGGQFGLVPFHWTQIDVASGTVRVDHVLADSAPGRTTRVLTGTSAHMRVSLGRSPGRMTRIANQAALDVCSPDELRQLFRRYVSGGHAARAKLESAIAAGDHDKAVVATVALKQDLALARQHLANGLERDASLRTEFAALEGLAEQLLARLPDMCGSEVTVGKGVPPERTALTESTCTDAAFIAVPPTPGVAPTQVEDDAERTVRIAAAGVAAAAAPLPHRDAIQRSFGRHGIGDIRVQVGGGAAAAAGSLGSVAYAFGSTIAFAHTPDLFLAAHEAAHVVQQRAGVDLPGSVGKQGDAYERHADAVAATVVRGLSAEHLLDRIPHGRGRSRSVAVQRDEGTDRAFQAEIEAAVEARFATDDSAYIAFDAANSATESGGSYRASERGTSAGQPASLGRGQLLVRLQVAHAISLVAAGGSTGELITICSRLTLADLREIDRLGTRVMRWYDNVTGVRDTSRAALIGELVAQGPAGVDEIIRKFGAAFNYESGGLPASELRNMAAFRGVSVGGYRQEYRALHSRISNELRSLGRSRRYRELREGPPLRGPREATIMLLDELRAVPHGASAHPPTQDEPPLLAAIRARANVHLDNASRGAALRQLAMELFSKRHPELSTLLAAHTGGRNQMTAMSLHQYFMTSTNAEDRNGWYTLGAMQSRHWPAFEHLLPSLDIYTTQERSIENFGRALAFAQGLNGFDQLSTASRAVLLGQFARINHGGTAQFNQLYYGRRSARGAFAALIVPHSVDEIRELYRQLWSTPGDNPQKMRTSLVRFTRRYLELSQRVRVGNNPSDNPSDTPEIFLPSLDPGLVPAAVDIRDGRELALDPGP